MDFDESSNRLQGKITGEVYIISSLENQYFFLQKDWVNSRIVLEDGDVFDNLRVRYQVNNDELIAYNDKLKTLFKVDKNKISKFYLLNNNAEREFVRMNFDGMQPKVRFFERLYTGKCTLLAYHNVDEIKVTPYEDKSGIMRDSQYKLDVTYFMYTQEKGFDKVLPNKRSFFKLLPQRKKEIRKIFRQNKLILSGNESMIQAFKLIDGAGLF